MNVFVRIIDPIEERITRYNYPELLKKALRSRQQFMFDTYIVEFYSVSDEKKLVRLYSSNEAIKYDPKKDELFIICGLYRDKYDNILEEMKLEYAPIFREKRKERVQLYSRYSVPELQNAAREKFKGIFGSSIRSRVDCLMDDCDVIMNEYAHRIAKWIIEEVEGRG